MEDNRVHIFPKCSCPKMNVIDRLEFELASDNIAVLHVSPSRLFKKDSFGIFIAQR